MSDLVSTIGTAFLITLVILAALWLVLQSHVVQRQLPLILSLLVTFGATILFVAALTAPRLSPPIPTAVGNVPPSGVGGIAVGPSGTAVVAAGPPAIAAATATTVITATATPISAFAGALDRVGNAANPSLATLENDVFLPLVEFLALVLGAYVTGRLIQLSLFRGPQLVVGGLANASGANLANDLDGLSQLFRETLAKELLRAPSEIEKHRAVIPVDAEQVSFPVPSGTTDQSLNDLVADLKTVGPTQVQSVVAMIPALFPPRGTSVIVILGCAVPDSSRVRISLWISELAGARDVDHFVVNEPAPKGNAPAPASGSTRFDRVALLLGQKPSAPGPAPASSPSAERYQALFDVACRLLALALARRTLRRHVPSRNRGQWKTYQAEIANIFGAEYLASAQSFLDQQDLLYGMAVDSFVAALHLKPDMYQAFVNLGDTYLYQGQPVQAIAQYQAARDLAASRKASRSRSPFLWIERLARRLQGIEPGDPTKKYENILDWIDVKLALAGDPLARAKPGLSRRPGTLTDARLLYVLACWYCQVYTTKKAAGNARDAAAAIQKARTFLAFSLAWSPHDPKSGLWVWALNDPQLAPLRDDAAHPSAGLGRLEHELAGQTKMAAWRSAWRGKEATEATRDKAIKDVLRAISWADP